MKPRYFWQSLSPVNKHMTTRQLWFPSCTTGPIHVVTPCNLRVVVALVLDPQAVNLEREPRRASKGLRQRCSRAVITQIRDYLGRNVVSQAQNKVGVGRYT